MARQKKLPINPAGIEKTDSPVDKFAKWRKIHKKGEPQLKVTRTMRDTIEEVWLRLQLGDETSLWYCASEDPKWFYELCKGMFPKNLFVEAEAKIDLFAGLSVEQLIDIAKTSSDSGGDTSSEE